MTAYHALCDDFSMSVRIFTKLEIEYSRETLVHLFEAIQRRYPQLDQLRKREEGGVALENGEEDQATQWVRIEPDSLRVGARGVVDPEAFTRFATQIVHMAAGHLSIHPLDVDNIEAVLGFDLEYQGNHDELIAQALLGSSPLAQLWEDEDATPIDCQPFFGVTLSQTCDRQAYVELKSRTSTYEVRVSDYERSVLSTYLTMRQYFGFGERRDIETVIEELLGSADDWATRRVLPSFVHPLRGAIAGRR